MDVQLLIVIVLVALSAVFLARRTFGSLAANSKLPSSCAGCAAAASCGTGKSARAGAETSATCPERSGRDKLGPYMR